MGHPLISVIVPVYNLENYIAYCVKSILQQSFTDFELILIDDGSKDKSLDLCRGFARADERIRVITQANAGVSAARNTGLSEAQGRLIAFIDGDDYVAPDYLECLLAGMKKENAVLSMCSHKRVRKYEEGVGTQRTERKEFTAQECAHRVINGRFPVSTWGVLFQNEKIGKLRFQTDIRINEDKLFLYQYLLQNETGVVSYTDDQLYAYMVRDGSATRGSGKISLDAVKAADRILALTERQHPEWREDAMNACLFTRFAVMNSVILSKSGSLENRTLYSKVKAEIAGFAYPKTGGRRLQTEYIANRLGDGCYRMLVKSYYALTSDEKKFRTNEKLTRQK